MGRIRGDINPFTWVINDFSTLQSERIYSDEFQIGGCKWRLMAYPKGDRYRKYMSLYLDVADSENLPCGWRRSARFHLTVVNQRYPGRTITRSKIHRFGQITSPAGFVKMIHHSKLFDEEGFVVDGKVKILVRIHVFLVIVGKVNVIEVSDEGSEEESKEISEEGSKEESKEISEEGSKEGSEEGSESDSDTESEEASSPLKKTKVNDDGNTSNDLHSKTQQVKENIDVNGFQVLPSQVELVKHIFEKHPDMALGFRAKNQILRTACMNVLLSLIETLCQSPQELSEEDLVEADNALAYVVDAVFKVDWLEKKLKEVKGKKKEEQNGETRIQELEEELVDFKQKCSDTEALLEKEKAKGISRKSFSNIG